MMDTMSTNRHTAALRLLALRAELRKAREHRRAYRELRERIAAWDLEQVQAALTWHKLEQLVGDSKGLDNWELGMLHDARRQHDVELQRGIKKAARAVTTSTSKTTRQRMQAFLYRVAHAQTYTSPCRMPEKVLRDIQAVQREVNPEAHARRLKRKAKERKAERDASGETARRAQVRADAAEIMRGWAAAQDLRERRSGGA